MFTLITVALILSMFATLAMVLEHASTRAGFRMHMACAGEPVVVSSRAYNDILVARMRRTLCGPTMARGSFLAAMHAKHVTGRTLAASDRALCLALRDAGVDSKVIAHTASLLAL